MNSFNCWFSFLYFQLCFGEGLTESDARNKAANGALDLMYKLDFNNHFEQKYSSLEKYVTIIVFGFS